jgi:hypothetical protein
MIVAGKLSTAYMNDAPVLDYEIIAEQEQML